MLLDREEDEGFYSGVKSICQKGKRIGKRGEERRGSNMQLFIVKLPNWN